MTEGFIVKIFQEAIFYTIILSLPMLAVAIIVGLIISILQTATSIQEQTLTFVPKIWGVLITCGLCAAWLGKTIVAWTIKIFEVISGIPGGG